MVALVNELTSSLMPYPMEELARIRSELIKQGKKVYDFGTGDPKIKTEQQFISALINGVDEISQYPSILGTDELKNAHLDYLKRRFEIDTNNNNLMVVPTRGSKEAIFHIALSLIGRGGRKTIAYPVPGYPVYEASVEFAGGHTYPVQLREGSGYLMLPWEWPKEVINDLAAIWINYPHNPTGALASSDYLKQLLDWCQNHDVVLLADDCYVDIYNPALPLNDQPLSALKFRIDGVISFMSLSKRSGMTGYRAGMMAGDRRILEPHCKARARFGLAQSPFIEAAARLAWLDDDHVERRRVIFAERVETLSRGLANLGLMEKKPLATFYTWAKVPEKFKGDDILFCRRLAYEKGILVSPARWLGDLEGGYFRMACVPELAETKQVCDLLKDFIDKA